MNDNTIGRRIIVIGPCGAGKTTLAVQLGGILDIPVIHLDKCFWKAGWVETDHTTFDAMLQGIIQNDLWIIDGDYGRTLPMRLTRADAVIFLDFPRWICYYRIYKRWLTNHGRTRQDMTDGCPEKVDGEFLRWIWMYRNRNRPRTIKMLQQQDDLNVVVLRSPREVRHFINRLEATV